MTPEISSELVDHNLLLFSKLKTSGVFAHDFQQIDGTELRDPTGLIRYLELQDLIESDYHSGPFFLTDEGETLVSLIRQEYHMRPKELLDDESLFGEEIDWEVAPEEKKAFSSWWPLIVLSVTVVLAVVSMYLGRRNEPKKFEYQFTKEQREYMRSHIDSLLENQRRTPDSL